MANNYYEMNGVLTLTEITPVIKAIFGHLELDQNIDQRGLYFASIPEQTSDSWETVKEGLIELLESSRGTCDEEEGGDELDDADIKTIIRRLAGERKIGGESIRKLSNLLDRAGIEDDYTADVDDLFTLAQIFDDGHGLKSFKLEGAWTCDRPRLFEFGGNGYFRGENVTTSSTSSESLVLGENLEKAVGDGDTSKAAQLVHEKVTAILDGIHDESSRAQVKAALSVLIAG